MRRLVLAQKDKRLGLIAVFVQPLQSAVGDNVGAIAGIAFAGAVHLQKVRIIVTSLAGQDFPILKAGRIGGKMPLADQSRLITAPPHDFGKGRLRTVKALPVSAKAIQMAVFPRKDAGAGRAANRIGTEGMEKNRAFLSQTINVRRLIDFRSVGANGLHRVIIGKNEDNVGTLGGGKRGKACRKRRQRQNRQKSKSGKTSLHSRQSGKEAKNRQAFL